MNVSVFGLGYVGTVTAACLARDGHRVFGVDVNADKVAIINAGRSPIVEEGLGELLASVVGTGQLTATTDATEAIVNSDLALICVGTPGVSHGRPDVDGIDRVGRQIGAALKHRPATPFTVVLRSTVLPGTTERILIPALRDGADGNPTPIRVAVNPEFMREGCSLHDFEEPPLILAGSDDPAAVEDLRTLYARVRGPFVHTEVRSAELVKFACNTFHGLKVCFANEIAAMADALGADAQEVMRIFLMDRKLNVSEAYLRPGFAFGGSCLPKDLRALLWAARANEVDAPVLAAILPSNAGLVQAAVDRILAVRSRRIGVAGLAFKPGTDDLRESPVVAVIEALIGKGCDVRVVDRNVSLARLTGANRRYIETEVPHIASVLCDSIDDLVAHADVLVLGSASDDAAEALAAARPDCAIVDLTRGAVRVLAPPHAQEVDSCVPTS